MPRVEAAGALMVKVRQDPSCLVGEKMAQPCTPSLLGAWDSKLLCLPTCYGSTLSVSFKAFGFWSPTMPEVAPGSKCVLKPLSGSSAACTPSQPKC